MIFPSSYSCSFFSFPSLFLTHSSTFQQQQIFTSKITDSVNQQTLLFKYFFFISHFHHKNSLFKQILIFLISTLHAKDLNERGANKHPTMVVSNFIFINLLLTFHFSPTQIKFLISFLTLFFKKKLTILLFVSHALSKPLSTEEKMLLKILTKHFCVSAAKKMKTFFFFLFSCSTS